ncbi:metallophosphoesterase, partial [candidate division KSB1 bacterium]|nr:metallophosphoesterase [candidate division KSB1 bacterium]
MPWEIRVTLMITLMTLPFALYLLFRVQSALKSLTNLPTKVRYFIVFFPFFWYLLLPAYYLIMAVIGGNQNLFIRNPALGWPDYLVLFPFWLGLIVILESISLFLTIDLANLVLRFLKKRDHVLWDKMQAYAKLGIIVLLVFYACIRGYMDTYNVRMEFKSITEQVPPALQNLKLAFFADVQIDRYTQAKKLEQFKSILAGEKPDFIFFAGDLVTSGKKYTRQATNLMGAIRAENRIAVLGDHDYWSDADRIPTELQQNGWIFLQNEHRIIEHAGAKLLVTGVTHIYSQKINEDKLRKLLQGAPASDYKILLVHQPAEFIVNLAAEFGYQLMLAGHTHGGGIVGHFWGMPLTPSRFETRYFRGFFAVDQLKLVVTNGIGNTLSP